MLELKFIYQWNRNYPGVDKFHFKTFMNIAEKKGDLEAHLKNKHVYPFCNFFGDYGSK